MRHLLLAALFAAAPAFAQTKDQGDRYSGAPGATRSAVLAMNGMAATSQPLATQAALDVLKAGGSAVDAAIAANAVLGLVEPTGNGMGGDLFAIVWDPKTKKLHGLNASGRAPRGITLDGMKAANKGSMDLPAYGWLPVTVPGAVDGWFTLHGRFGRLPMDKVLAPAIHHAEAGFPVTELIAQYWQGNTANWLKAAARGDLQESANMARVYLPGGKAPTEGAVFRNPDLARTFRTIAAGGRDAFYNGPLTDAMVGYLKRAGAPHSRADFAAQHAEWVEPISTNYRGYDVWELPPNGQGLTALEMLNILETYDLKGMGRGSADFWHVMIEAKKLAYEDRAKYIADAPTPWRGLLSKAYARDRAKLIDMMRAAPRFDPGRPGDHLRDTIYLSVADKDGMMVSLIQSNYRGMGSGLVPDAPADWGRGATLGFTFHDRGEMFSLDPASPNAWAPGKRPFHTIIPAFVTKDGAPLMAFGLMGGDMQPQGHVQIIVNMVDFGMGVQMAGDAARYHHDGSTEPDVPGTMSDGGFVELESGVPDTVAAELARRGHKVRRVVGSYGGYQAVMRRDGVLWGASEMRKDGQAAGY